MCGRFTQISPPQRYAELFDISTELPQKSRYNVTTLQRYTWHRHPCLSFLT
jgi:putative SOS response-associated peptidase YedK